MLKLLSRLRLQAVDQLDHIDATHVSKLDQKQTVFIEEVLVAAAFQQEAMPDLLERNGAFDTD